MRRDDLAALGVQLPALPTVVLGALPGPPSWAPVLERIGLDVLASGAAEDTPDSWRTAQHASPFRPAKARAGEAPALAAAGCLIVETDGPVPRGCYALTTADAVLVPVTAGDPYVEDPNDVASLVLEAVRAGEVEPAGVWAAAGPGLDALSPQTAEAKLRALVEGVRRARLWLVKEQFDRD